MFHWHLARQPRAVTVVTSPDVETSHPHSQKTLSPVEGGVVVVVGVVAIVGVVGVVGPEVVVGPQATWTMSVVTATDLVVNTAAKIRNISFEVLAIVAPLAILRLPQYLVSEPPNFIFKKLVSQLELEYPLGKVIRAL